MVVQVSIGAIVLATCGFFLSRAIGGVVGEYGKRIWFKWIEPLLSRWAIALGFWLKRILTSEIAMQRACAALEAENAELRVRVRHLSVLLGKPGGADEALPPTQRLTGLIRPH